MYLPLDLLCRFSHSPLHELTVSHFVRLNNLVIIRSSGHSSDVIRLHFDKVWEVSRRFVYLALIFRI